MKKYNKGFTLIELMIVIAIIGILAAVGYPAYTSAVKKAQRADAIDSLVTLAASMEEYYMANDTYIGATIAKTTTKGTSSEGYYRIQVLGGQLNDFYYRIRAAPNQTDAECGSLLMDSTGRRWTTTGATDCW